MLVLIVRVKLSRYRHAGDKKKWSASLAGLALPTGKGHRYPLDRRLGGPQRCPGQRLEEKSFASARDRTVVVQSVVRHYTG
jgi:hypothetical protein